MTYIESRIISTSSLIDYLYGVKGFYLMKLNPDNCSIDDRNNFESRLNNVLTMIDSLELKLEDYKNATNSIADC